MATSASDRLGRLFADKFLPPKPDLKKINAANEADLAPPSNPTSEHFNVDYRETKGRALSDDSDVDDYIAAFSQTPRMKATAKKNHTKREARALESPQHTCSKPSKSIKFPPTGKKPISLSLKDANREDEQDQTLSDSGDDGSSVKRFCQFNLLSKFPYKYMDDPQDRISRHFFANNKFYERTWNLYYLQAPQPSPKGPLLLVSFSEVQALLKEVSAAFEILIEVPRSPFTLKFHDDGTPQPIFLGTSQSREEVRALSGKIPEAELDHGEPPPGASEELVQSFESYIKKCEKAWIASKGKGKSTSAKAKAKNTLKIVQESQNQIKRAERYMGLRPRTKSLDRPEGLSWTEEKANELAQLRSCGLLIDFLDVNKPSQYSFDNEPVVISVDIEWYERDNSLITEVGVSVLDTLDLVDLAPGTQGENWVKQIRSRHFRIRGREHLVNREFCTGDPNAFRFGKSEFVALNEISAAVDSCFEWPFSAQFRKKGPDDMESESSTEVDPSATESEKAQKGPKQRNLLLLGHDVGTDLRYLQELGSEVFNVAPAGRQSLNNSLESNRHQILSSVLETLDTAILYQSLYKETQPRSLAHICNDMGIDAWHMHNGGNDARYTLECFIKIAIKARLMEDEAQRKKGSLHEGVLEDEMEAERLRRIDEKMDRAREKIKEDNAIKELSQSPAPPRTSLPSRHTRPIWPEPEDSEATNTWSAAPKAPRAGW